MANNSSPNEKLKSLVNLLPVDKIKDFAATEIINHVRTVASSLEDEDADPWDEKESGVAWLDNEVGFAEDILAKFMSITKIDMSKFNTVKKAKQGLISVPLYQLLCMKKIIVDLGGTSSDVLFSVRDSGDMSWFKSNF